MTAARKNKNIGKVIVVPPPPPKELATLEAAMAKLPANEYNVLKDYIESGKLELSIDLIGKFFNLYLNGSDTKEIYRLNPTIPYEAIIWARFKYNWDRQKEEYIFNLQVAVRDKVLKAQLDTTELMTDILAAAKQLNGDKIKRYLQTKDVKDLEGALQAESITGLLKVIEGLQKITGQDNIKRVKTESTQNVNVNITQPTKAPDELLSPEASEKIMAIMADEKRKRNAPKQ